MGPIIRDWNERRVIRPRVKRVAALTVVVLVSPAVILGGFHPALKATSVLVGLAVIAMIYRQPSNREATSSQISGRQPD